MKQGELFDQEKLGSSNAACTSDLSLKRKLKLSPEVLNPERSSTLMFLHPLNILTIVVQPIYHDCNQFFLFKTYALMRDQKLYTEHTLPFILAESESQDIDTMEDWKLMEMKYDLLHQKD